MADRYWVGGSGNWSDDTNHWATVSGGLPGAGNKPTSSDNAHFDSLSNATAYTVTIDAAAVCLDFLVDAQPLTSGVVTFAGTFGLTISGNFTNFAGSIFTATGTWTFNATTSKTITSAGSTITPTFTFNGSGGTWTLQDNYTSNTASRSSFVVTLGTFATNAKTVSAQYISIANNASAVIDITNSTINLNGANGSNWLANSSSSVTTTGSTININGSGAFWSGAGKTYATVNFNPVANGGVTLSDGSTFATLTFTGANAVIGGQVTVSANQTVAGTFTASGNAANKRLFVRSSVLGTARTITAAVVSISNVDFMDTTGAGAGTWSGTSIGNALGNSGITFDTPVTATWTNGAGGTFSTAANWSTGIMPLPQDTVIFDGSSITSSGKTITMDARFIGASLDMTNCANSPTYSFGSLGVNAWILGNFTLSSASNVNVANSGSLALLFAGRGSHTIDIKSSTYGMGFDLQSAGGTYTLNSNIGSSIKDSSVTMGTITGNGFGLTGARILSTGTLTRTINMGSGTWTVAGSTAGNPWNVTSTGLTFNANTSLIKFTDTSNTAITFTGAGFTYYSVWFSRGASTATITIAGSNTFQNQFKDDGSGAHTMAFTTGTTQTFSTGSVWQVSGTATNTITINSTTTGTHALTVSGSGVVSADYLNIQHSVASPGTLTWYAGANSTNNQATATAGSGWIFTAPPVATANSNFFLSVY